MFAIISAVNDSLDGILVRPMKNGDLFPEDFCRGSSRGFSGGIVSDICTATESLNDILGRMQKKCKGRIRDVYSVLTSTSVEITPSSGLVLLSRYGREVEKRDVNRCVEIGATMRLPLDRYIIHKIVTGFSIDGDPDIKNPIGLDAVKLSADINVLTLNSSIVNNMSKCISYAGYVPAGFFFSGIVTSYRSLFDEDKEKGVLLLNICRDMTEATIFYKGTLTGCRVFSLGVNDMNSLDGNINAAVLNDLAAAIRVLPGSDKISKTVVIGQGKQTDDLIESLEKVLSTPVEAGTCISRHFEQLPIDKDGYTAVLGCADLLAEEEIGKNPFSDIPRWLVFKANSFLNRYF
ncbi:MAG: hypothetical protein PHH49_05295 [Candidatus Omnitrophica bacterium]|nr:hypothetical protein [Candidatus Omnitrophota bacterium]MDD5488357.1 hypothetical protein [Candidatus Omnitrophota bacterium]